MLSSARVEVKQKTEPGAPADKREAANIASAPAPYENAARTGHPKS